MKILARSLRALAAASLLSSAVASADTLAINSGWVQQVQIMNPGDYFSTFYTALNTEAVNITGFYFTGDYYRVSLNGNTVLTTSSVGIPDQDLGDSNPAYQSPGPSFASGLFSTGTFYVNPSDVIVIYDLAPPLGIGEVAVEAVATPEPASFPLLATTLLIGITLFGKHLNAPPECRRK